jgi:predicted SnoaL-like aldol condensation-catalyzing enzyme
MVSLRFDRIEQFIEDAHYAQHASKIGDGIARLRDRIANVAKEGGQLYLTPRRFVAEGNFVLVLSEGDLPTGPTALYDLFRVENGKIVEHWDVLTPIPPRDQWKNSNGPFQAARSGQHARTETSSPLRLTRRLLAGNALVPHLFGGEPLKQKIGEDFDPLRSEPSGRRYPVHGA